MDDQQKHTLAALLFDASGSNTGADRAPADASPSSNASTSQASIQTTAYSAVEQSVGPGIPAFAAMPAVLLSTRCRQSALKATMLTSSLAARMITSLAVMVRHDLLKPAA
jgi:hypothetical protein